MASETAGIPDDLEQLRQRFEEFRKTQPAYSRLPESLWAAATELAKHHGVNPTARALRLEYNGLRKRVENQNQAKAKRKKTDPPSFLEFVAPGAKAVTDCTVEVETAKGSKLRLELKAVPTTELADLIRAFGNDD
jgi:hypothetical protein